MVKIFPIELKAIVSPIARTEFNEANNKPVIKKYKLFLRMGKVVLMDSNFIFC